MEIRVTALDADFVNALYHASQNGFPNALNAIVGEGRLIALTSTVVEELTLDPENHPKDAAVEVWIDNQKLLDNLKVYDTSGFAPGEDRGEQSILSALPRMYADGAGGVCRSSPTTPQPGHSSQSPPWRTRTTRKAAY